MKKDRTSVQFTYERTYTVRLPKFKLSQNVQYLDAAKLSKDGRGLGVERNDGSLGPQLADQNRRRGDGKANGHGGLSCCIAHGRSGHRSLDALGSQRPRQGIAYAFRDAA